MSDVSRSAPRRLPDLYGLLGLAPLESDRARIEQALRRLASHIQTHTQAVAAKGPSGPQLDRARKLFELGKQHLLEPAHKARYDEQWQAVYGALAVTSAARTRASVEYPSGTQSSGTQSSGTQSSGTQLPTWELSELQVLLPAGDVSAPFNSADFLASRSTEIAAGYAQDFDKLLSLLKPSAAPEPWDAAAPNAQSVAGAVKLPTTERSARMTPGEPSAVQPLEDPLQRRLRKMRGPNAFLRTMGALAAVGIVLGLAYWRVQYAQAPAPALNAAQQPPSARLQAANGSLDPIQNPATPATASVAASANPTSTADQTASASVPGSSPRRSPRRSGLPSVPGIQAILPAGESLTQSVAAGPAASQTPVESAVPNSFLTDSDMPDSDTPDSDMPNSDMPSSDMPDSDMPAANAAAGIDGGSLKDDERQQWTAGMLAVRKAIGQHQFAQASAQLESLRPLARTRLQVQQLARWTNVEQLVQRFRKELDSALAGMQAAESFSFGNSNLASFVEFAGERVVLRIEGRNRTFAMSELPIEIALAIADMAMDRQHPQSLAAKAAFILVHPDAQQDELSVEQAQQMMSAAIAAQELPSDMLQAWQEDFALP